MNKIKSISIAVVVLLIVIKGSIYILPEGRQAIITEFGKPIGAPVLKAGIHFKKPLVQKVRYVDKRILYWDGIPNQIPTKDKKYIKVDTTARWKIIDVLKFIQTVQNERGAKNRLDSMLESATRDVVSNHNLVEVVRNSNLILKKVEEKKAELQKRIKQGETIVEDEISVAVADIYVGREKLSKLIVEKADEGLEKFGIKLVDVQLRRISYEKTVEKKVYERMISERQKIAQKIRSIGQGERAKIEGRLAMDLRKIESEAYRESQYIKGKAEAKSIAIYAKAMSKDPKFYDFVRSMEAYKKSFSPEVQFLLSSDSEFLRFLKKGN